MDHKAARIILLIFTTEADAESAGHQYLSNNDVMYKVSFRGHTSYISGTGNIATHIIGSDGGLYFPNFTGGMTTLGLWGVENSNGGGRFAEAGGYVSTDLGLIKEVANYFVAGEFKSATTFKGWNVLRATQQAWRYENVLGSGLSKTLTVAGHVGTVLGAVSAGYSTYKVVNQIQNGGIENVNGLDASDAIVGWLWTASTVALAIGASNPIGWAVLGVGATTYGVVILGIYINNGE